MTLPSERSIVPAAPPPPPPRQSRGCLWGVIGMLGCSVILLLVFLLPVILGVTTVNTLLGTVQSGVSSIFNPAPPAAVVNSTQSIVQSVLPLGQLVSVSMQLAKADIQISVTEGVLNACGHAANHVAVSSIEAGVDLTQMTENDVQYDAVKDQYVLNLPAPQLTSCRIDFIRQYDQTTTTCGVDWDEIRLLASSAALEEFRADAVESGILVRAEREATIALETFVEAVTGKNVEVNFRPIEQSRLPVSCVPEPPAGWVYNTADHTWTKP
jgi:hypothetical protein